MLSKQRLTGSEVVTLVLVALRAAAFPAFSVEFYERCVVSILASCPPGPPYPPYIIP